MENCLANFPEWAVKLMDSQMIWFSLDLEGNFSVNIDNSVSALDKGRLLDLLQQEINKGHHEVFEESIVH